MVLLELTSEMIDDIVREQRSDGPRRHQGWAIRRVDRNRAAAEEEQENRGVEHAGAEVVVKVGVRPLPEEHQVETRCGVG